VLGSHLTARALLVALSALYCACEASVSVSEPDAGPDKAGPTTASADALRARRARCEFGRGARVTDTLPISERQRAALPIAHVVIAMKENRSFDHLLGWLSVSGQPEAEAIPGTFTNLDNAGAKVGTFHFDTTCVNADPGHQWDEMHRQVNGGAMDGFVVTAADSTGGDGHFVMGHYEASDLPFYYWLANTFAISDRHFASARAGTWPNRNFLLLGTADGVECTYCSLPQPTTPTLFDALDAAHVSWGVYTDSEPFDGALGWSFPHPGLRHLERFFAEAHDGTLPAVSFVDAIAFVQDEHPTADVQVGEAWTRTIYQAVVDSPLWPSLALIWTYDEGGGFTDHVPPPNQACVARIDEERDRRFVELGVRVPLTVISPYARAHHVSHEPHDHTAITRFIEAAFGLPALGARDANSDALLDMFDFAAGPALLHPPQAPESGTGGCVGNIMLSTDQPSYISRVSTAIRVAFSGVGPKPHDRIGLYPYPRQASDVPTPQNPIEPLAWGYIGGQGHTASAAPDSGSVVIDARAIAPGAAWPPAPGLWIIYYLPSDANDADGHTPAASVDLEITR
jgi:phospholipase C